MKRLPILFILIATFLLVPSAATAEEIVHDSEYYVLEAQNAERWAADDQVVDQKLAEFRKSNGGKPPNILYILI